MIVESFLISKMKNIEKFEENNSTDLESFLEIGLLSLLIILIIAIFYTFGAVSLSWRYNTYIGTSYPLKLLYAILVFIFPSLYYPVYAFFFNPITGSKVKNTNTSIKI
jgi:uncharacterized membrane protein